VGASERLEFPTRVNVQKWTANRDVDAISCGDLNCGSALSWVPVQEFDVVAAATH